jgi:hypothetical protein
MSISQDTFNKMITLLLFFFFMAMYVISFVTSKPIDWQAMIAFIIPTANHIAHQITGTQVTLKNVDAAIASTNGTTPTQVPIVKGVRSNG